MYHHTEIEMTETQIGSREHVTGSCLTSCFRTGKRANHQECFGCLQTPDAESQFLQNTSLIPFFKPRNPQPCGFFFFKNDFDDQRNMVSALCCILLQLWK
ncbi:hypothetical protein DM02DRAFT_710460, partial [Periconia macrospinosa]